MRFTSNKTLLSLRIRRTPQTRIRLKIQLVPLSKQKPSRLKKTVNVYTEIIAVCSQIHTKHINTLSGHKVIYFNVKSGGTYINHKILGR
jgi:hypothetical protein